MLARKKKHWLKNLRFYLIFGLLFTVVTSPLILFYGPFSNVKKTIVGASMTTLSHQWIAKMFLSDAQIKNILSGDTAQVVQQGNDKLIKFINTHDNTIERYNTSNGIKFTGYNR